MYIFQVLIPKISIPLLYYKSKTNYKNGDLVNLPFRNKAVTGIIWSKVSNEINFPLKEIIDSNNFACNVSTKLMDFLDKASRYYLSNLGGIAKLSLPVDINEKPFKVYQQNINLNTKLPPLSDSQKLALKEIRNITKPILLKGVTGSGKTELYFHMIFEQLKSGKQSLILLPEISLSKQIISRFTNRFGFEPVIWNSDVTKAKKKQILRGVITGEVKVIIGARSALFLPYKNLGIIAADEEHDSSYKQSDGVVYNARDMAVLRSKIEGCLVILGSATPSMESIYNVQKGKYHCVELITRHNKAQMPDVRIIDLKQERLKRNSWISPPVLKAIEENHDNGGQTLVFLNRKGYAPLMLCTSCGHKVQCNSCSAFMVVHKKSNYLMCHHCGYQAPIYQNCPECVSPDSFIMHGPGIERIEEEIKENFSNYCVRTISRDFNSKGSDIHKLLSDMELGNIDILIGTQIITKGYHFANLTLVVIVDADVGFLGGDLRGSERMFQMLNQVGGRAGRESKKGSVIVQTYSPQNKVIQAIANNEETKYIEEELRSRKVYNMPPFSRAVSITFSGKNDEKTKEIANQFVLKAPASRVKIMGPVEAMIHKVSDKYRYKILIIAGRNFNLQKYLQAWKNNFRLPGYIHIKIDLDPLELW